MASFSGSYDRRPVQCPYCPKVMRADQLRLHSRTHREVREARKDLADDLQRLEMAEYEQR